MILIIDPYIDFSFFLFFTPPDLLILFSGNTSQINSLHPNHCFRICLWECPNEVKKSNKHLASDYFMLGSEIKDLVDKIPSTCPEVYNGEKNK